MHKFIKSLLSICLVVVLFFSCRKQTGVNWDVDAVFPIVNSTLNIKNFLGDSIFKSDNTGLLNISLTRTITALRLDSLLKLPDTTIVSTFTSVNPFGSTLTPGQSFPFLPAADITFNIGDGTAIKFATLAKGTLNVKYSNTIQEPLDLIYVINGAVKNGSVLTIKETIPPGVNALIKNYDLSGYTLNMRGISGMQYNTLAQNYTITLNQNANPAQVNFGQGAKIEVAYSNVVPNYVEGYFGTPKVEIPLDTANFSLIDNFSAENFMLSSAVLDFKILNEFGVEFTGGFSNIKSINKSTIVPLITSELSNININRASKVGNTVYQTVKTVSLSNANSNIAPFLSNLPDKLVYQGTVNVNPLGNISGYNDFAFGDNGLTVLADVNIPMRFNANNFVIQSKTSVDFSNIKQLENVNSGTIIISALNGYPFAARLQAYMLNASGVVIDSLFNNSNNQIAAGQVNAQNIVVSSNSSQLRIPLTKEKISKLKETKNLKITSKFIMPPNPPDIKIYDYYTVNVNITADLNYHVKSD